MLDKAPRLVLYRLHLVMRYTRISCRPFGAVQSWSRLVQAIDRTDAVRQACLCVDRELEELLARINAINVSEVIVEPGLVEPAEEACEEAVWNPIWFPADRPIPRHIVVRRKPE